MALRLYVNFDTDELEDMEGSGHLIEHLSDLDDFCDAHGLPLLEDFTAEAGLEAEDVADQDPQGVYDYFQGIEISWHDPEIMRSALGALRTALAQEKPAALAPVLSDILADLDRIVTLLKAAEAHDAQVYLEVS